MANLSAIIAPTNVVTETSTQTLSNKTLVAPALGIPASGTVTNLTGTASININGTVGATTASSGAFTSLSATGVTTLQAGTAALPAITTTGDTNTGIFFPAADTIAFAEGGAEAMRITSDGNVGIGTSSPDNNAGFTALSISNTTGGQVYMRSTTGSVTGLVGADSAGGGFAYLATNTNHAIQFKTNNTERARIDTSGRFMVGTATALAAANFSVDATNTDFLSRFYNSNASPSGTLFYYSSAAPNGTSNWFIKCQDNSAERMYVRSNGGIGNYQGNDANLSDRREKTNFAPAKNYLDIICSIPIQTFNYIDQNHEDDPGLTLGVVAQDVQEVAPEFVMESNWGTEEEPKMRLSIYQTDLQYALMKCIQEQQAMIASLKARLDAANL